MINSSFNISSTSWSNQVTSKESHKVATHVPEGKGMSWILTLSWKASTWSPFCYQSWWGWSCWHRRRLVWKLRSDPERAAAPCTLCLCKMGRQSPYSSTIGNNSCVLSSRRAAIHVKLRQVKVSHTTSFHEHLGYCRKAQHLTSVCQCVCHIQIIWSAQKKVLIKVFFIFY